MKYLSTFSKLVVNIIVAVIELGDTDDLIDCCRLYNKLTKFENVYKLSRREFKYLIKLLYHHRRMIIDRDIVNVTNFMEIIFHLTRLEDRDSSDEELKPYTTIKRVGTLKSSSDGGINKKFIFMGGASLDEVCESPSLPSFI